MLENLLRFYMLKFKGNREDHLSLVKFTYTNSYQAIIGMLYLRHYMGGNVITLLCWDEVDGGKLLGPELVQMIIYKVKVIRERMKKPQNRQKSYVDNKKRALDFNIGDQLFLKVAY